MTLYFMCAIYIMLALLAPPRPGHPFGFVSAMKPPHKNSVKQHRIRMESLHLFGSSARTRSKANAVSSRRLSSHTANDDSSCWDTIHHPPDARYHQPFSGVFHRTNTNAIQPSPVEESPSCSGFSPIVTPQCAAVYMASRFISERRRQRGQGPTSTTTGTTTTSSLRGGSSTVLLASSTIIPIAPSSWMVPAVACATSYALYNLFIKKASDASIDPILGGVLLQFVAAWIGTCLWLGQRLMATSRGTPTTLMITKSGIIWSVAAGVAVGAAEILSFIVSGKGVPATQSIPIIVGGSILVGTLLGAVWLQERLSKTGWMGVVLIAAGIALVGLDGVGGH
jgi:transporter family protein